jgi:SAM-dependent methyltransferase
MRIWLTDWRGRVKPSRLDGQTGLEISEAFNSFARNSFAKIVLGFSIRLLKIRLYATNGHKGLGDNDHFFQKGISRMKSVSGIGLPDVQAVYSGAEGELWELIMGEQVHIGGLQSSMALAEKAAIGAGMAGVDLCCCTGAGMRALIRLRGVARMTGVDATARVIETGRRRCREQGVADRVQFVLAEATVTGLPSCGADFVWGEDAWCYVVDKPGLIAEAVRIVKKGGIIAFTDWVEGPAELSAGEAERFLKFMKFANMETIPGYRALLTQNGCRVIAAEDTGRFAPCVDLYLDMVNRQLTYDCLRILGFDSGALAAVGGEMVFTQGLARAGKVVQGLFVAKKLE